MSNTKTAKVRFCPFCGHHGHRLLHDVVNTRYEDGSTEERSIWQMECECCGARGPTEYTPDFAVESWNAIYRNPAHDDDPVDEDFEFEPDDTFKDMGSGFST